MEYRFKWDLEKGISNRRKHGVSFEQAATVFLDSDQLSIYDDDHSDEEDRWVTLAMDSAGRTLVVVHTYIEIDLGEVVIRIISARNATRREIGQYQEDR